MQNKNILFIISSLASGGAERVVSELANRFAVVGHKVSIMLTSVNMVNYDLEQSIEVISLAEPMRGHGGPLGLLRRLKLMRKYTKEVNPDVVISFLSEINTYSCIALMGTKYKLVVSERNDPKADPADKKKRMLRDMMYPLADGFVFQTAEAQRYFSKKIQKRSTIIANPIKANLPEPFEGERTDRVVALGRLEPQKNYPLLFRAFKRVAEKRDGLTLDIYGGGSQQENLAKLIAEMGMENKIFLRGISANVHDEVLDASAFVLSSDFEGMPNALMEAMAIGLPCISTDCPCGGPEFLIDNEVNGLLVPVKDEDALVNALERVLSDKNFSQRISENAVKLREECNLERIADKWLEFIEK